MIQGEEAHYDDSTSIDNTEDRAILRRSPSARKLSTIVLKGMPVTSRTMVQLLLSQPNLSTLRLEAVTMCEGRWDTVFEHLTTAMPRPDIVLLDQLFMTQAIDMYSSNGADSKSLRVFHDVEKHRYTVLRLSKPGSEDDESHTRLELVGRDATSGPLRYWQLGTHVAGEDGAEW